MDSLSLELLIAAVAVLLVPAAYAWHRRRQVVDAAGAGWTALPAPLFRVGPAGELSAWTPEFERLLDAASGALAGSRFADWLADPDSRAAWSVALERREAVDLATVRLTTNGGRLVDVHLSVVPIAAGGPTVPRVARGLLGLVRPATRDAESDSASRSERQALRALVDALPLAVVSLDREGRVGSVWNPAAEQLFGWTHDEVHGRVVPLVEPMARDMAADAAVEPVRVRRWRRDGSTIDLAVTTAALPGPDGGPDELVVVAQEIAERLSDEEEHRQLSELVEATPDVVVVADGEGAVLHLNPAARERLGIAGMPAAMALKDLHAEDWPVLWQNQIHPALVDTGVWAGEVRMRGPGGEGVYSQVVLSHRSPDGGVGRISLIARDITQQRLTEEQLRQAQKLDAVGQLTGGIAHDFNNLLTVVQSNAELAREEPDVPLEAGRLLDDIEKAALRGRDLVRQLMVFSRRAELHLEPTHLEPALRGYDRTLMRLLPDNVRVQWTSEEAVMPAICDVGAVEQILLNLATNARDAMPKGGRLDVSLSLHELPESERFALDWHANHAVQLSVRDTGAGIPPESLSRIFDPFYTTKDRGEGTGLGLAMVYALMTQMGGAVRVESEIGRGTTFRLLFQPAAQATAAAESPAMEASASGTGQRLLLVDDEESVRRVCARMLERLGYRVQGAGDGLEALRILQSEKGGIDLVISDVLMPGLDGPELLDAARRAGWSVPFLFISGYTETETREATSHDTSVPILQKPWTRDELARSVHEALGKRP